LKKNIISIKI